MSTKKTTTPSAAPPAEGGKKKPERVRHVVLLEPELDNRLRNLVDAESGPPLRLRSIQDVLDAATKSFVETLEKTRRGGKPYPQRPEGY